MRIAEIAPETLKIRNFESKLPLAVVPERFIGSEEISRLISILERAETLQPAEFQAKVKKAERRNREIMDWYNQPNRKLPAIYEAGEPPKN